MNQYGRTGIAWLDRLLGDGSHLCGMLQGAVTLTRDPAGLHVLALYGYPVATGTREALLPRFRAFQSEKTT